MNEAFTCCRLKIRTLTTLPKSPIAVINTLVILWECNISINGDNQYFTGGITTQSQINSEDNFKLDQKSSGVKTLSVSNETHPKTTFINSEAQSYLKDAIPDYDGTGNINYTTGLK